MEPHIAEAMEKGAAIDGDDMYFRATPYFETQSEKYAWLNNVVTVGKMRNFGGGKAVYDIFEVL